MEKGAISISIRLKDIGLRLVLSFFLVLVLAALLIGGPIVFIVFIAKKAWEWLYSFFFVYVVFGLNREQRKDLRLYKHYLNWAGEHKQRAGKIYILPQGQISVKRQLDLAEKSFLKAQDLREELKDSGISEEVLGWYESQVEPPQARDYIRALRSDLSLDTDSRN